MADFYQPGQRQLQQEFQSTALADRLEKIIVQPRLDEAAQAFIAAQDHFYLSTVDAQGFPTVSYEGGAPGFVQVVDASTLRFPCFDGNGMWLSMGNIADVGKIGMLFINTVQPHRVRVQGNARLLRDPLVLEQWQDVGLAVEIAIASAWINCPRYIHPMQQLGQSPHVPTSDLPTQAAQWKSLEIVADVLPPQPHEVKDAPA
ncbi:MAG: pyridoxamine 5'-phosphate oxidase family protein [Proteobacteria bacterium]|nr:pyridoxamine 5'-phosphate oxidase family protein [Pseudomonadota bacterium]